RRPRRRAGEREVVVERDGGGLRRHGRKRHRSRRGNVRLRRGRAACAWARSGRLRRGERSGRVGHSIAEYCIAEHLGEGLERSNLRVLASAARRVWWGAISSGGASRRGGGS